MHVNNYSSLVFKIMFLGLYNWRASEASETLFSHVYGNSRYIYIYIRTSVSNAHVHVNVFLRIKFKN